MKNVKRDESSFFGMRVEKIKQAMMPAIVPQNYAKKVSGLDIHQLATPCLRPLGLLRLLLAFCLYGLLLAPLLVLARLKFALGGFLAVGGLRRARLGLLVARACFLLLLCCSCLLHLGRCLLSYAYDINHFICSIGRFALKTDLSIFMIAQSG